MTPSIVDGLRTLNQAGAAVCRSQAADEPELAHAAVGRAVSHGQVVHLWKSLAAAGHGEYTLETLLKGSSIYVPPPAAKPEPSDEYKALMARLRREQEQQDYERMTSRQPQADALSRRHPAGAGMAQAFASVNRPSRGADVDEDGITYGDVHRQMMLIFNFAASILGVAATLWIVARWWSTPARLFLTMGGSLVVGIAEVAVYSGYVWHLGQAKKNDEALKEVKEVVQTWAVAADGAPKPSSPSSRQPSLDKDAS
ncbi:endoplasmic reticulum-based factor for assembly of V-ATPase-domain-containing protein [Staphylotrichum tortipilum]|uniref:Endoplasmic reticulum-based factor for assembly of V-ATPase-domain-containing protein n=1 Tax=Staphylotrichum tortipilum TaxID=2831512 RepID=A0AAN6MPD0_9PEZI|nr:endoplasmic reticulum-based factor for assembly of V-ATPase-domain-containing protein [Staphylotrichum longicolle]